MTTTVSGSQIQFNDNTTQNTSAYGGGFAMRNRIINGDFRIDQRNAGASVTSGFPVDRFQVYSTQSSKWTAQQSTTAPAGFKNSVVITSTSSFTPASGDYFSFTQRIEGFNTADLGWGTANAQTITVSFWVRSSLTGTFGGALHNNAFNRVYPFSYTINSANTFEYKTVTIAGDTTGTWLTDNSVGIEIGFAFSVGSSGLATAGSWSGTASIFSATGQTNLLGTNGATFYITGVQIEKGSTATSFDYRPYSSELAMCQRYYWKNFPQVSGAALSTGGAFGDNTTLVALFKFPVTMRTNPTCSQSNTSVANGAVGATTSSLGATALGIDGGYQLANGSTASFSGGNGGYMYATNTSGFVAFSAEL